MSIRLIPTPYLIESLINADHWEWPKAFAEFIDNSFGEAAGASQKVEILIKRTSAVIMDDGNGIANLEQCFRLGDSNSRHSVSDIGRYGVGAKHAAVWMGKRYMVATQNSDKGCQVFEVNWDAVRKGAEWPTFSPEPIRSTGKTGTYTLIRGFWPQRKRINIEYLARSLSETFAPALEDGKTLIIIDERKKDKKKIVLKPWRPKGWSDRVCFKGSVSGREYTGEIGVLSDHYSSDSGLRICFAHRVLQKMTKLNRKALPVRLFGYIRLSDSWKDRLATNKTEIVDSEDLEQSLLDQPEVKRIIKMAEDYQQEMLLEGIVPRVELFFERAMRRADDGEYTARGHRIGNKKDQPKTPNSPPDVKDNKIGNEPAEPDSEKKQGTGLKIAIESLGEHTIGQVQDSDDSVTVVINRDCPACRDALNEATARPNGHYPALFCVIGAILSIYAREATRDWLYERLRIAMPEVKITEVEIFLNWWFFKVAAGIDESSTAK
jgi:hypothetical protein